MTMRIASLSPHELPGHLPGGLLARVRWHQHTPYATALAAWHGDRLLGVATGWRLNDAACITGLYTVPGADEAHAGLCTALVAALVPDEAPCLVHAAPANVARWTALDFVPRHEVVRIADVRYTGTGDLSVVHLEPPHWLAVFRLDRMATGMDRRPLLLEHAYLGQVYVDHGHVRGFLLPLLGNGLIVADGPHVGLELQRWLLPVQPQLLLPGTGPVTEQLSAQARDVRTEAVCLVRGHLPQQSDMLYADPYGAADGEWPDDV